jgi:hypothetical protein
VWGRTGCSFDGSGRGSCATGDCGGALSCMLLLFQLWPRYDPVLAVATAGEIKSV